MVENVKMKSYKTYFDTYLHIAVILVLVLATKYKTHKSIHRCLKMDENYQGGETILLTHLF